MSALAEEMGICPEHGFVHGTLGPASRGPDCNWRPLITDRLTTEPAATHEDHERAEKREAVHRLGLQDFGEDFEVYRSGAATTLLCLRCAASRTIIGRIRLTALVDEAAAHADTCPGRED